MERLRTNGLERDFPPKSPQDSWIRQEHTLTKEIRQVANYIDTSLFLLTWYVRKRTGEQTEESKRDKERNYRNHKDYPISVQYTIYFHYSGTSS
jgi:cobalamin-dependent methionine synthase I